jgi:MFS family permease
MSAARARPFYGWWVAGGFALMVFLSSGIRFTAGPFLKPMVDELGLDRASLSLVLSVSFFLYGVFTPFLGGLAERVGARAVTAGGAVVLAGSLAATGLATRLWHLHVIYGLAAALGVAATGPAVGSAVVSRWFVRRRATALSLLGAASMAGMSALVPVTTWLILTLGWRAAYAVLGVAVLALVLPLGLWVVRDSPEAMGLHPDGVAPTAPAGGALTERTDLATALRALPFWQLSCGMFICGFSMSLLSAHGIPMLTDHGYHAMMASWALGLLGASSMLCALALGAIADRVGRRPVLAWLYGTRALLFMALFLVHDSPVLLLAVAVLGGVSMSGTLAMSSAITADLFGRWSVGSVFGTIFLLHQAGAGAGAWLGGLLFEITGGYGAAFTTASVGLLGASAVVLTLDEGARCAPRLRASEGA